MKKFLVIYYSSQTMQETVADSTIDKNAEMQKWMDWAEKCGSSLVDMGAPLGNAHKMSAENHGPSESSVTGYSILQAESWDEVNSLMQGHPHLAMGECEIEIHEAFNMSM